MKQTSAMTVTPAIIVKSQERDGTQSNTTWPANSFHEPLR